MEDYYTSQSKSLDVKPQGNGNQVIEYIPLEEVSPRPQAEEFGFGELWRRLMQRKWLLLGITLAIFLLSVLITLTSPDVYRATATLQVTPEDLTNFDVSGSDTARTPMSEREFYLTQTELLRSQRLTKNTLAKLEQEEGVDIQAQFAAKESLRTRIYNWFAGVKQTLSGAEKAAEYKPATVEENFQRLLAVYPIENSQIFRITFDHTDPELAAKVVNTLADEYKDMSFALRNERVERAKTTLEEKLAKAKEDLLDAESARVAYAKKKGIITLGEEGASSAADSLGTLNTALIEAKEARIIAEAAYQRSKKVAGADRTLDNPAIQVLKEELARAQAEYRDQSRLFKPSYPEMQQLQARIDGLRREIRQESSQISSTTRGRLKAEYEAAKQRETKLKAEVKKQERVLVGERDNSVKYSALRRDVEAARRNYDGLAARFSEIELAEDSGASNVAIVDSAAVPARPYTPNIPLNLGIGAIVGLVLGLLAAVFIDIMDDRIRNMEDMKRTLGSMPMLGVIPYISGRKNRNVLALRGQVGSSFMLEAFRSLRENIVMLKPPSHHGIALTLNVTSPSPSEGKSTTAVNLATVFAYTGKKVLLIDCDMRHPEAHNKLGLEDSVGVSDYLIGEKDLEELLRETPVENLSAITSGTAVSNPTELLASERFSMLLTEAEGLFDYIIIDSPPVMGLADALILSNRAGNTILVGAYAQTRRRNLRDAQERLQQAQSNVIGAVLTKIKSKEVSNKYYGYPSRYPRNSQGTAMVPQSS